jgi:hypothetical protein
MSRLAVVAGSRDLVVYSAVADGGGMALALTSRAGAGSWAAPVSLGAAEAVPATAVFELASGEWMAVWSAIALVDVADPFAGATLYYAVGDAAAAVWNAPAELAARPGAPVAIFPVVGDDAVGCVFAESRSGPNSARLSLHGTLWNGATWEAPTELLAPAELAGVAAAGSGGSADARIVYVDAAGVLSSMRWDGETTTAPAAVGEGGFRDAALAPDGADGWFLAAARAGGGIAVFTAAGNGDWTWVADLATPPAADLAAAFVPGSGGTLLLAWGVGGGAASLWIAAVDAAGAVITPPRDLTTSHRGIYRDIRIVPTADDEAAVFARFDQGAGALRRFDVGTDGSVLRDDSDGDGIADLQELQVIDGTAGVGSLAEVDGAGDPDGDSWTTQAELLWGSDPADADDAPPVSAGADADGDSWPTELELALAADPRDGASVPAWQVALTVADGPTLIVGMDATAATDSDDLDVAAPAATTYLVGTGDAPQLSTDFRPPAGSVSWLVYSEVDADLTWADMPLPVGFAWTAARVTRADNPHHVDPASRVSLSGGGALDVAAGETWRLTLARAVHDVVLDGEWRFFSLPLEPAQNDSRELFAGLDAAVPWGWDPRRQQLRPRRFLQLGEGLWIRGAATAVEISGRPSALPALPLRRGWNTAGVVLPLPAAELPRPIVSIWGWDGTYTELQSPAATLMPGAGYWLFAAEPTDLPLRPDGD